MFKQKDFIKGWRKPRQYYYDKPNGYAALPGSGEQGKTCKTCSYRVRVKLSSSHKKKYYNKCKKKHPYDDFQATIVDDIKISSPACKFYQEKRD